MPALSLNLLGLQLFAGLALGCVYVLLAIGLSLIFGMLTVVNFAHGAFFMLGAYVLDHGAVVHHDTAAGLLADAEIRDRYCAV